VGRRKTKGRGHAAEAERGSASTRTLARETRDRPAELEPFQPRHLIRVAGRARDHISLNNKQQGVSGRKRERYDSCRDADQGLPGWNGSSSAGPIHEFPSLTSGCLKAGARSGGPQAAYRGPLLPGSTAAFPPHAVTPRFALISGTATRRGTASRCRSRRTAGKTNAEPLLPEPRQTTAGVVYRLLDEAGGAGGRARRR